MDPLYLAFLLIAVGLLLLLAELVIPSGTFFALAVVAIVAGVVLTFTASDNAYVGWITLVVLAIGLPIFGGLVWHFWPRLPVAKRFFLTGPEDDATVASMPVNMELEQLRGRYGRALSALRPSGVVDFDGRRIDTITEGMMVEAGQLVRCIDVKAGRVIVRPVEQPNLGDLENATFD